MHRWGKEGGGKQAEKRDSGQVNAWGRTHTSRLSSYGASSALTTNDWTLLAPGLPDSSEYRRSTVGREEEEGGTPPWPRDLLRWLPRLARCRWPHSLWNRRSASKRSRTCMNSLEVRCRKTLAGASFL